MYFAFPVLISVSLKLPFLSGIRITMFQTTPDFRQPSAAPAHCLVVSAAEEDMKLARFLQRRLRALRSLPLLHKWLRSGQVRVNGRRSKAFARLAEGDVVRLPPFIFPPPSASNSSAGPPLPRVFPFSVPTAGAGSRLPQNLPGRSLEPSRDDSRPPPAPGPEIDAGKSGPGSGAAPLPTLGPGLDIVAVSGDLLMLNKSAGLSCHPGSAPCRCAGKMTAGYRATGKPADADSVSTRLAAAFAAYPYLPAPVHRLDRRTSGLLSAGLSHACARRLHELFRQGGIARYYLAWVWGRVPWVGTRMLEDRMEKRSVAGRERTCALPVGNPADPPPCVSVRTAADATGHPPPSSAPSDCSGQSPDVPLYALSPQGRQRVEKGRALCAARVVRSLEAACLPWGLRSAFSACSGDPAATLLLLRPLTGHKHQLRAQLAARCFPLIGDPLYGGPPFKTLFLHACALRLPSAEFAAEGESGLFFLAPPWEAPFAPAAASLLQQINGGSD
jgi:23S rRNA pseudouridine955/2504/2580 synthase